MKLMMKCLRNGNHTSSHMYVIFFQMKIRTEKNHYKYRKGATQKIFLEFGLFFFYRNNNRLQPENCNRLLFFL